ncbi:MAG: ABC transporter substrate-binding protein [Candidatus Jacksonbacteria bacterium]|mgnify:CR=1 FL=1|jgi:branched-chain amino acid transport system substrate-binding protein|nr:ABC transporter substrate-binding protein [Candidatus Jacksonbacteria bacterium]MBT6034626.1 ABC transporter substrate-binding protein [Candidatus Jacksonbacteria bacterium]MBT6301566.1 ABC transporter substrate-binding protein [Candidatus Jacksonbacteria bacterium]MBT6757355.1 ABC transporter substrate-binding protein [Candidatus Jacksonbacteria bacterium]MBT6954944.1 ABC transporter substrate-binding protein [Candidatus Jacksonbacteria bacterium]
MNSTAKIIIGLLVIIAIIAIGTSFSNKKDSSREGAIRIGVSIPVSGEAASFGEAAMGGLELAVKEINEAGGVDGRDIELIIEDDKCSKDGSTVINKLSNIDKVAAIIGPICSSAAGPGVPISQAAGVPTVMIGASAPALTSVGDYIFRNYPADTFQGAFAAKHIAETYNTPKVALLYVKNDWGQGLHDVFVEEYTNLGGEVVFKEGVAQDTTDLRTSITKLKDSNPEVIYYPMYPAGGIAGLQAMRDLGVNVPVISGDTFDSSEVLSAPAAEGVFYLTGKFNNPEEFKERVTEETGIETINIITPIAYDAVYVIAEAIKSAGSADHESLRDALNELVYNDSVAYPVIEFDEIGELTEVSFQVNQVKDGSGVAIE